MAKTRKHIILYIFLSVFLILLAGTGIFSFWLSGHYKQIIREQLPGIVSNGSDSIYHVSYGDVTINLFKRTVTITNLELWPDLKQAAYLREQHRRIPPTLSTVSIPLLEAKGFAWKNIIAGKIDFENVIVHDLKWKLVCTPRPQDSSFTSDKQKKPFLERVYAAHVNFINPDLTYYFRGLKDSFFCFMKGGAAALNYFSYNTDNKIDTSVFLYAKNGKVRFNSFIFLKSNGRYTIKEPLLDFTTSNNSITLKDVKAQQMTDVDPTNGLEKEIYDLNFPSVELTHFNWNNLINHNTLRSAALNASAPTVEVHYIREHASDNNRKDKYPNQLLLQVGLQTDIKTAKISNGHFKYVEVTKKGDQGIIDFSSIHGQFSNITNIDSIIAKHKNCVIKLEGKYQNKSDVLATFDLSLADTTGHFKLDGYVKNLDGNDVSAQAAVFTLVKVTSFHLNRMDMHIEGDASYEKGNFTVLYQDLKISLFKFDTKARQKKRGTLSFLGSALLLYPSNPMPNQDVRTVTTSFARDTTKGFIYLIWQNMFRAAKKTAMREKVLITITDGPETSKGEPPKKGILKRLFGKKNK